jgi:hypothetical protein
VWRIRLDIKFKLIVLTLNVDNLLEISYESLAKIHELVYTLLSLHEGGNTVTSRIGIICLVLAMSLMTLSSACLATPATKGDKSPVISSLEANYTSLYPKGMSEIKCVTSAPVGDTVQFTWSSDGGNITGDGPVVTWQAPNDYGNYHVMVTAKDNNGGNAEAVVTLSVVPRPQKSCCGRR